MMLMRMMVINVIMVMHCMVLMNREWLILYSANDIKCLPMVMLMPMMVPLLIQPPASSFRPDGRWWIAKPRQKLGPERKPSEARANRRQL